MANGTDRSTVVGVFHNRSDAERAVDELHRAGFREDQIGYAARGDEVIEGGTTIGEGSHAGSNAAGGALTGGVIGGILGALATGLIPGIGPVIAGGLLAGVIGGAAVGVVAGGLIGALTGMGVPEDEARYYDTEFQGGGTLVTVKADGRYAEARSIMQRLGAYDYENRETMTGALAREMGTTARTARTDLRETGRPTTDDEGRRMQLREEELTATKRPVETGGVEISKDVVSQQRSIDVPVTREEVYVERRAVDRRPSDRPIAEGETIEVPVREERVEVEKQPVVYEEVDVGKRRVQDTQRVSDTVQREELRVDREGDVNIAGGGMERTGFRSWDEVGPTYRQDWERRYGSSGRRWQDVEPYRRYGYEMANDPRYRDRDWNDVESSLRTDYPDWSRRYNYTYDESAWDRMKDNIREAWQEARATARR